MGHTLIKPSAKTARTLAVESVNNRVAMVHVRTMPVRMVHAKSHKEDLEVLPDII